MTDTPEQERMLAYMRRFAKQFEAAHAKVAAMEEQRADLYIQARALTPPLTFRQIAQTFGVTESAVMQKISRRNGTAPSRRKEASS